MIVLYEFVRQAQSTKLIGTESFHEEPTAVLKNLRNNYCHISEMPRL